MESIFILLKVFYMELIGKQYGWTNEIKTLESVVKN